MKGRRSRLLLMGVLALALALTVGLVSGSVADAKKKKKKGAKTFSVALSTPTAVPLASPTTGPGVVKVPIGTVSGKKLKGKVISLDGATVTTTFSGDAGFANFATAGVGASITSPGGRLIGLNAPFPNNQGPASTETTSGPTTETANSPVTVCIPATPAPPPPCANPDATLGPPYAGTMGNLALQQLAGASPLGTWFVKVFNFSTTKHVTLNSVSVTGNLINAPTSS